MSGPTSDGTTCGPEEFLPGSNATSRWGVRPVCEGDDEFLRGLGGPKNPDSLRRGESLKVIEVEGEPVGFIVLRRIATSVSIEDLRLLPHWRWRGIEVELIAHLETWAGREGRILARPAKGAFPEALGVGEIVRQATGSSGAARRKKDWGPTGRTWLLHILSFVLGSLLLIKLGGVTRTALTSDVSWLQPQRLLIGLELFLLMTFGILGPTLLAELRGRLLGGRVHADLGAEHRLPWLVATAGFLLAALTCVLVLGPELDRGGAFARLLLVPAVASGLFALRRGQVRERGILRPDFPGFVPRDVVSAWRVADDRLGLTLARHVPGARDDVLRFALRSGVAESAADTLECEYGPPSAMPLRREVTMPPLLFIILFFGVLGPTLFGGSELPERPPGTVGFSVTEDTVLTIGEENDLRLFPWIWTEDTEAWEDLDAGCFDFPRESIEVILEVRNGAGRRTATVTAADGSG